MRLKLDLDVVKMSQQKKRRLFSTALKEVARADGHTDLRKHHLTAYPGGENAVKDRVLPKTELWLSYLYFFHTATCNDGPFHGQMYR